jgi:hypothetical protein
MGQEPGGPTRTDLRIAAPEGVYLRFVSFGEAAEHDPVPELGPYAVVVIGRRNVEADGDPLATRTGTDQNLWELTGVGGNAFVGVIRPDIALRTRSTAYHPDIKPFRAGASSVRTASLAPAPPAAAPAVDPRPPAAALPVDPRPPEDGLSLRDRIGSEPSTARSGYMVAESLEREWGGAAWRLRYLIIGALVALVAVFSVPSIRSVLTGGGPTQATVGVGTALSSPEWTYNVGSVRRVTEIGASRPRGSYVVVQVGATNRGRAGAQISPSNFSLADATGQQYAAQPTTSGAYFGEANPDSGYIWPTEFPVGRQVVIPLIFDVSRSVSGMQLVIVDVPLTRVRLE